MNAQENRWRQFADNFQQQKSLDFPFFASADEDTPEAIQDALYDVIEEVNFGMYKFELREHYVLMHPEMKYRLNSIPAIAGASEEDPHTGDYMNHNPRRSDVHMALSSLDVETPELFPKGVILFVVPKYVNLEGKPLTPHGALVQVPEIIRENAEKITVFGDTDA